MDKRRHNVCTCACERCHRGMHCRGEFCKSAGIGWVTPDRFSFAAGIGVTVILVLVAERVDRERQGDGR